MGVLQGRRRVAEAERATDGEHGLSVSDRDARVTVPPFLDSV